ncbi:MAG: hypothetical protein PVH84_09035 [Candidatus Aminicenantes bacterium]
MQKRIMRRKRSRHFGAIVLFANFCLVFLVAPSETLAQVSAAEEVARRLADPLADIQVLLNENDVFFFDSSKGQKKGEFYNFKLTPGYAVHVEEEGYSVISRAVVPFNGRYRSTTDNLGRIWGLGDTTLQILVAPKTETTWKWGVGPLFSFKTRSQPQLGGIDYGIGVAGALVGNLSSRISLAVLVSNSWSLDGKYSFASIQPFLSYHFKSVPGLYVQYRQATTINWKAEGTKVILPLGASIGRTWLLANPGHGFDLNFGIYFFPIRPDGVPLWSLKFGVGFVLP